MRVGAKAGGGGQGEGYPQLLWGSLCPVPVLPLSGPRFFLLCKKQVICKVLCLPVLSVGSMLFVPVGLGGEGVISEKAGPASDAWRWTHSWGVPAGHHIRGDEWGQQGSFLGLLLPRVGPPQLTDRCKTPGKGRLKSKAWACVGSSTMHCAIQTSAFASLGCGAEGPGSLLPPGVGPKEGHPRSSPLLPGPGFQTLGLPFRVFIHPSIHPFIHSAGVCEDLLDYALG